MMWLAILAVGAGSYLLRLGPLLLLQRVTLSERADRAIRHAGLAAIAALIATSSRNAAAGGNLLPAALALAVGVALAARNTPMPKLLLAGSLIYTFAVLLTAATGR